MIIDYGAAVSRFPAVYAALDCEPFIRPDLTELGFEELPLVLLSLMNRGVRTVPAMCDYLDEHGARFDMDYVIDVLEEHAAVMSFADGTADGLWYWAPKGILMPTIGTPD